MQGQFTCDLNQVTLEQSQPGAVCTPQGRMYSSFRLVQTEQEPATYWLRMRQSVLEPTLSTLGKYIVFFKAEMTDLADSHVGVGLLGNEAQALLEQHFSINLTTESPDAVTAIPNGVIFPAAATDSQPQRWECWLPADDAIQLCQALAEHTQPSHPQQWQLADIEAGLAEVDSNMLEAHVPQMLNYQATGAISFTKGCYTGQEIVARTQYRGKAKRQLFRLTLSGTGPLAAGDELQIGERSIGTLAQVVTTADNAHQALAILLKESTEDMTEVTINGTNYQVSLGRLPYNLD